jgi:H/ACA ribonucleoprotein complex subunit 4
MDLDRIRREKPIKELIEFSIINIDKPSGPTSFQIDLVIKHALGLDKSSHFGTLDPKVTGVLPIALGKACRLSSYFMGHNKTYVGVMRIHENIAKEKIQEIIDKEFTGKIKQTPPKRSKVKRQEREREIVSFEILEKNAREVLFITEVQAGTYIRKLIHDLGEKIGGAHMIELRRTQAGIFTEENYNFTNLYDFQKAVDDYNKGNEEPLRKILIPAEVITEILPSVQVKKEVIPKLFKGSPIHKGDLEEELPDSEKFAVFCGDQFIETAKKFTDKNIIAWPEFVFR